MQANQSNKGKPKRRVLWLILGAAAVLLTVILLAARRAKSAVLPPGEDTGQAAEPGLLADPVASGAITIDQHAVFSGEFVEDGQNELVESVAAILVTNRSGQFLDLATLTYDIDGQAAAFVVTGLPDGRSAWVLEDSGLVIGKDAEFTYGDCVSAFRADAVAETADITVTYDGEKLVAVNHTDAAVEDVFVCYKRVHTDGNFFGGIAYRVDFGTLEPGGSAESVAGHYIDGETEIVRIGWRSG